MSIIISDLSYRYPNQDFLFEHLNLSVTKQSQTAIVGNNGSGKSTLLKLLTGELQPVGGSIATASRPYYIPQHTGSTDKSVAEMLEVKDKLTALNAIINGSISQSDYDTLADDWTIEAKCMEALAHWRLSHIALDTPADRLSGGEKTKVFLSGLLIHRPEILLLDEPTNHLDGTSRQLLYRYIRQSTATIVVVSHDITLLNQLQTTCELSKHGIHSYGGNFSFYQTQKEIEDKALNDTIHAEEKAVRMARIKAQEVKERQEKRLVKGEKKKMEVLRALRKKLTNSSENTAAGLKEKHEAIIGSHQTKLSGLKQQQGALNDLKINFDHTSIHPGKLLIEALQINFAYQPELPLWEKPLDFNLYSHDRICLSGDNGTGKTTFIKLLTGLLHPACGTIRRADFRWIYLDQNYSQVDVACSIEELAETYNRQHLETHEVRLRLNRFLFPSGTWDKPCKTLSGGEKMRLYLCCLMISNQTPDLIILDEPTNNLDIASLRILTQTISNYKGSLLVVSHDEYFISEIGTNKKMELGCS
ncbi:MAG: ATP-binding cassette domain-containing protein [Dysgonamonadaceae bacterium]|jgi:ATPase subunit of ABC transporter with duplicated ATPase domains|nr:ATP-binding cassette domain-containing protein [Dysgonamonadaceae bacterium]